MPLSPLNLSGLSGEVPLNLQSFTAPATSTYTYDPSALLINPTTAINQSTPLTFGTQTGTTTTDTTQPYDAAAAAAAKIAADKAAADAQSRRDLTLQNSYLGGAETEKNTSMQNIQSRLDQILGGYTGETARNQASFNEQSGVNQSNYNRDLQTAMINSARGRQGLFGTLSALGALSGSGIDLADRAVQQGANLELADANENFDENTSVLNTARNEYLEADKRRRAEAEAQAGGLRQNATNSFYKNQQDIYVKMANLYNSLGDSAQADAYTQRAGELANLVGATGVSPVTALSPTAAAYSPAALGNFMSQGPNEVSVAQGTPGMNNPLLPSLMASIRRREQGA